ncbi:MAG TPA: adenylate/guanylate cyclase domain-containing protein, partial [Gemmatimonadaceae bacterium]
FRGLGSTCRVIVFDKRGTGLSSRDLGFGSLAERSDDALAVMNAAGWKRAHLFGMSEGGPMTILLATTCPERVESLSLYGTYAVGGGAKPDDPAPPTIGPEREALLALLPQVWGTGVALRDSGLVAHADEAPEGLGAHFERNACTPHMIAEIMRSNYVIDVRPILSAVHVPTLVLHASGDPVVNVAYGRHLAEHIDGARYVELPLVMHTSWRAEDYETLLDTVLEFVAGARSRFASERVLATVMFTDIVESTRRAAQIGDRRWNVLLDEHDLRSRQLVASFGGQVVKQTGDGMLATFDGPARAVQCAQDLRDSLAVAGVPIRAGLHAGEVERRQNDLGGIAVHIAARVAALAKEGEVLVSRTVRDLVVGSGLDFEDRGAHELKGIPENWQIYAAR